MDFARTYTCQVLTVNGVSCRKKFLVRTSRRPVILLFSHAHSMKSNYVKKTVDNFPYKSSFQQDIIRRFFFFLGFVSIRFALAKPMPNYKV